MQFTMKTPCEGCPFRRSKTAVRIDRARAEAIAGMMADSQGGTFPCHKTTAFDDEGDHVARPQEIHCAGALIFAEKQGNATQMMRIAERLGMYDAAALMKDNPAADDIFDSVEEMVAANTSRYIPAEEAKAVCAALGRKAKRNNSRKKKGVRCPS